VEWLDEAYFLISPRTVLLYCTTQALKRLWLYSSTDKFRSGKDEQKQSAIYSRFDRGESVGICQG
jgi:hypothetical protein